ncbi:TetR family transcriptional regulator [Algiphilus sp.]|uniref:TetR family transcriptional regulator n=1 Tax=Algiphilus sp. TaxID=1872431 RepID=UPI002A6442D5|nr:TetR family transcriptional regulator [Pseudomonadota bacterium]
MRRTKEETAETRDALLDAAETVFLRRGVARATLEEIAREAGMTRGAIYWHFSNKEAIYAAMLERVRLPLLETELQDAALDDPFGMLERFAEQALARIARDERIRHIHIIVMLRRERLPGHTEMADIERDMRGHFAMALRECFRRAQSLGLLRDGIPPERAARAYQGLLIGLIYIGIQDTDAFRLYDDGLEMMRDLLAGYRAD